MFPGELWLNFGPAGLDIGGFVYGAALPWTYRLRKSASVLVRGMQPTVFVCVLLLWTTNLTWRIPKLFICILMPILMRLSSSDDFHLLLGDYTISQKPTNSVDQT